MKRKTTFSAIGGYQPFLFAIGMYVVALFFSIFICSAIFNVLHPKKSVASTESVKPSTDNANILLTVAQK